MIQLIGRLICIIVILVGVVCVFDARNLTNKFFSFGDQNEGASGLKILGFIISIISAIILMFIKWLYIWLIEIVAAIHSLKK